jgi:hypothetical protein
MVPRILPRRDLVRQLLDYDADTGVFTWRPREVDNNSRFNTRFAGKAAGWRDKLGYCCIEFYKTQYMAHRLAWLIHYGEPVPIELDHADGDGMNNRIVNLRPASRAQNVANRGVFKSNRLGIKGVRQEGTGFRARIRRNGRPCNLGTFATAEEAAEAYREAAVKLHGEFARFD